MAGRYKFFIATVVPTAQISICSVAVFGTRYIRDTPLTSTIVIKAGDQLVLSVEHVYAENVIAD